MLSLDAIFAMLMLLFFFHAAAALRRVYATPRR